jgi:hypothetical protein
MRKNHLTSYLISPLVVFGLLAAWSNSALAYQTPAPRASTGTTPNRVAQNTKTPNTAVPPARKSTETYDVVSVGNDTDGFDFQVVSKSGLKAFKKKIDDDYLNAMKEYNAAKKNKNNQNAGTLKPPVKKVIKSIPSATFKTEEEAKKFAEEKKKERDKGSAKKTSTANTNW